MRAGREERVRLAGFGRMSGRCVSWASHLVELSVSGSDKPHFCARGTACVRQTAEDCQMATPSRPCAQRMELMRAASAPVHGAVGLLLHLVQPLRRCFYGFHRRHRLLGLDLGLQDSRTAQRPRSTGASAPLNKEDHPEHSRWTGAANPSVLPLLTCAVCCATTSAPSNSCASCTTAASSRTAPSTAAVHTCASNHSAGTQTPSAHQIRLSQVLWPQTARAHAGSDLSS